MWEGNLTFSSDPYTFVNFTIVVNVSVFLVSKKEA